MRARVGKILRGIGLLLLGLALLLGLLWVLRVPLFGGLVKREITSRLESALGGRYEIDSVGGTWFGGLRIDGLRTIEAPPDGALRGLSVEHAEVDYDLLGLLGDAPLAAIDAIRFDGGALTLDVTRPAGDAAGELPDLAVLDAFRGSLDLRLDVVVETGEGPASIRGLRAALGPDRPLELTLDEVVLPERFDVRGAFAGRVERVDADTWRWTSEAEIAGLRVPEATVTRNGRVTATLAVAGGRVVATFDADGATAQVASVDLAQLPAFLVERVPDDVRMPVAGRLSGSVAVPWGVEPLGASFDLTLDALVWSDQRIEQARLRGSSAGSRLTLAEIDARGDGLRLRGREIVLDLAVPQPLRGARTLILDVERLRAFVPELEQDLALSLRASGPTPGRLDVESLVVRHASDRLEARGTIRLPEDPVAWRRTGIELTLVGDLEDPDALELPWTGPMHIEGRADGALEDATLELLMSGAGILVERRPVDGARLVGRLAWPNVDVSTLEIRAPGVTVDASGRVALDPLRFADAAWTLAVDDLAQVASLVPDDAPSLAGRLRSAGRLSWDGERVSGSARISVTGLEVDGNAVGAVTVALAGADAGPVRIDELEGLGPWGWLRGAAAIDLQAGRATVDALAWGEELDVLPRVALRAPLRVQWSGGELQLMGVDLDVDGARARFDAAVRPDRREAQLEGLEFESPDLRLRLLEVAALTWQDDVVTAPDLVAEIDDALRVRTSLAVDLGAESAIVSLLEIAGDDVEGRLLAPLRVSRLGEEIFVHDLDGIVQGIRFHGAGRIQPERQMAVLERLRVRNGDVDARLERPLRLLWRDGDIVAEGLDVAVLGGRVRGDASWDGALHAALDAEGFALGRWVDALAGRIDARVRVDGERLAVQAEIPDLAFQDWRGAFRLEAVQDETGPLVIRSVRLSGPRGGALEGGATLPWRLAPEGLVDVPAASAALELSGRLGGLGHFTNVADGPVNLHARGDATGLSIRVRIADVGLCDETLPCDDVGLDLRITPEQVKGRIALGSDDFLRLRGHLDLDRGFDWTRPATLVDLVAEATIDGEVDALVASWSPLARVVPDLRRLAGGTRLRLVAKGPLRSPSVDGVLTLSQVGIELDTDVAPFEQVDARLVWKDDTIRVEQLEGLMGFAPFSIQGEVRLVPDSLPVLDLTLRGRNTQLIRTEWFRMRIDVDGRVTGPLDRMHVEGEGRIVDSIYREPVSLTGASGVGESSELILFEIDDAPFDEMTFDLGVRADRTIHIRNNLLRVDLSFDGRLKGKGARPALEGLATFDNAEILLPLTTLRDGTGEVEFLAGSPGRPRIQMTAQTRTKGYEMGLQVAGRLPDVDLHVFTEPPLDDEDAMLMLATGSTGSELSGGGILGKTLAGVVSIFGGSLFTSGGDGGEPGQKAFFERFEVSADLDGTDIRDLDAEFELDRRFYLHVKRDRFQATNLGLIWRLRFR